MTYGTAPWIRQALSALMGTAVEENRPSAEVRLAHRDVRGKRRSCQAQRVCTVQASRASAVGPGSGLRRCQPPTICKLGDRASVLESVAVRNDAALQPRATPGNVPGLYLRVTTLTMVRRTLEEFRRFTACRHTCRNCRPWHTERESHRLFAMQDWKDFSPMPPALQRTYFARFTPMYRSHGWLSTRSLMRTTAGCCLS